MTEQPDYFTKHLFRTGVQCPRKLFYKAQDFPESKQSVPFIKHAVLNKRLLKSLLRSAYPEGKFVERDLVSASAALTSEYLQQEKIVLFDAIFVHRQMMSRLPIIVKNGGELTIFHIQAKAFDPQKHRLVNGVGQLYAKWRGYLLDFAYQLFILKQNFPDFKLKPTLVLPEKRSLSHSDNLPFLLKPFEKEQAEIPSANQQLLIKIDVSQYISKIWNNIHFAQQFLPKSSFEESLEFLQQTYFNKTKIPAEVGLKCKSCEFRVEEGRVSREVKSGFNHCWQPHFQGQSHIFDLIGPGTNDWVEEGIYDQRDINNDDIFSIDDVLKGKGRITQEMRQALQIHKAKGDEIPDEIIHPNLIKELERWEFPLHFLDFEAGNYSVPVRSDRSPYYLVIFQFSCHTLHKDGSWSHHQWIDDFESDYVNYELIRQLKKVPNITEGTIVEYSNFERHALKTIRRELSSEQEKVDDAEKLIDWIEEIIKRKDSNQPSSRYMVDLSRQVKHFYYNREMENSLSVKDVLRSVMSHSEFLKQKYSKPYSSHNFKDMIWWQADGQQGIQNPYHLLTKSGKGGIRRGTEAMVVYGELISQEISAEEREGCQKSLLRYCELDTLAMMMIYQHWQQEVIRMQ